MIKIKRNPTDYELLKDIKIVKTKGSVDKYIFYNVFLNGKDIGGARVDVDKDTDYVNEVYIDKKYRLKGIGTFLYDYIEKDLNVKLKPSNGSDLKSLSKEGKAFWQNRLKRQNPTDKSLLSKIQIRKELIKIPKDKFRPRNTYYTEYRILLNGKMIGKAEIKKNKNYISWIEIDKEFQRKGLSTCLYDYIEKDLGIKLKPSINQLDDGVAFWKSRK